MADNYEVVNLEDLAAFAKKPPRADTKDTVASRAAREKSTAPPKRPKEVPLNVDVAPEIKKLVLLAKAQYGIPMKSFVTAAIEHYWRALESGVAND